MSRSKSSRRWLERHRSDPYVKRSRQDGHRSRAAYKLLQIQAKDHVLAPGMRVLDLGAAPGGWSQIAMQAVGRAGRVIALDLLPLSALEGVTVLQGDFRDESVLTRLREVLAGSPLDLLLSDMAPNLTGTPVTDQSRTLLLAEMVLDLAQEQLKPGGSLVVKVFHGAGFDAYLRTLRDCFHRVASRKPQASRPESRELYLVAKGFHP